MYSSTPFLTSAVNRTSGERHAPAALPLGKNRYPLYRRLGGPRSRSGQKEKISPSPGFFLLFLFVCTVWITSTLQGTLLSY